MKTTLNFTDRHHRFLARKVEEGVFATTSGAVAAAVERMIEEEAALDAMGEEIRVRMATPRATFVEPEDAFTPAREALARAAKG